MSRDKFYQAFSKILVTSEKDHRYYYAICKCVAIKKPHWEHVTREDPSCPVYEKAVDGEDLDISGYAVCAGLLPETPRDIVIDFYLEKHDIDIREFL